MMWSRDALVAEEPGRNNRNPGTDPEIGKEAAIW